MGVVQDLVTEIRTEGGFEVTESTALTVLDRRHKQMCARARWHRMSREAAADTALDAPYSTVELPGDAVEAFTISFPTEDDSPQFTRTKLADRPGILDGTLVVRGRGGVFVEAYSASELEQDATVILYPAVTDGAVAQVEGAFVPPTLLIAETGGAVIRVPSDFYEALLAGVYASLLSRPGESRPDLAAVQEATFAGGCEELRTRADLRYRTRGPRQIRILGQTI